MVATRLVAEGELVVVEAHGRNITKAGEAYNNMYCFVFRLADGQIREVTEYMDTAVVNRVLPPPS